MNRHRATRLFTVAGLGLGGYLLYSYFNKASAATNNTTAALANPQAARNAAYSAAALNASVPGVSFAPSTIQPGILTSTLTAVPAVTSSQMSAAQSFWSTLSPVVPLSSGYIMFPSGSQAAAATFGGGNTAMDGGGNVYVQWAGQVYQLGSQDSAGNYPAMLVSDTGQPSGVLSMSGGSAPPNWLGL